MFDPGPTQALRILALDVASNCGIAWGAIGDTPRFLSMRFTRDGEASSMEGCKEASARAIQWVAEFTRVEKIDRAVIEAPIPESALHGATNAWATALKFSLIGSMSGALSLRHIPTTFANIQAVRKFFIGKGNLSGEVAKPAVKSICAALGWQTKDYDQADAAALWLFESNRLAPRLAHRVDPISLGIAPLQFDKPKKRERA